MLLAEIPRSLFSSVHNSEVNCGPLSDVRSPGTPKRAIQCRRKPLMHVSVLHSAMGIASAHRVYRSTMVKRYVMDSTVGRQCPHGEIQSVGQAGYVVVEVHGHAAVLWRIGRGDMFGTSCRHRSSFCAR